ncbi:hypothetical protein [uncultured Actinomyces sp.]|uniref:hypothetical protein n=1 Tax=uncultured Actinomyces sp. TaxID=249061 RepID=UPI0028EBCA06|nr:hypothetical protein [uncultured Actinomyces sp.]
MINADEDSYLLGVEQRYVVEFSCASTTEDCLDSVVTISSPHTITPGGNPNPDSAPEGINATATARNKVVTPEIKRPTATTDGLVTYNLGTVAAGTSFQTVLTFTAPRGVTPGGTTVTPVATFGGVWVFRTVCFERVVLSSPGRLCPRLSWFPNNVACNSPATISNI